MSTILDSGERREFETGAVRDIQEGKGRCDLLPTEVLELMFPDNKIFTQFREFEQTGRTEYLVKILRQFARDRYSESHGIPMMILEVSKHFEEGAKKYGEYNWQKGIPVHCYIDSAIRHYLKYSSGYEDEPHDRAFCWNLMCCIWTIWNKPELDDYTDVGTRKEEAEVK